MEKRFSIPSKFSLSNDMELNNPDFHLVKIRIMSSGENYNGSSFTIDSLNKAKNSVAYTPILANIIEREDGELDANGHDIDFEMKVDYKGNTVFKETYVERPVGVFLNNSTEVIHDDENDVDYIQAYGIIWKTYSDAYEVLKRDEVKDVSVEIECLSGNFRDDGYYEIHEYNILGTTILGNGCLPAIENSRIEFNFSRDNEYENKLKEIDKLLTNFDLKGGEVMEEKEMQQEFEQQEQPQEEVEQPQEFAEEVVKEEVCEECGKNPCECEKEEEFAKEDEEEKEENVEEEEVEEKEEEKKYSQEELDNAIANTRAEYSQLIEELETLREFKAEYDRQVKVQKLNDEMDNIVANFNVEDEFVKELKEKVINGEYSMEKFELELFRNNTPIKKEFSKKESNKLPVIDNEVKMTDADHFFASYGVYKK